MDGYSEIDGAARGGPERPERLRRGRLRLLLCLALAPAAWAGPSARPGWGGTPYADAGGTGVTFRVWAPAAADVVVAGTFNGWSTTATPLASEGTNGCWSADVGEARAGDSYKYLVDGNWRTDPRALAFDGSAYQNTLIVAPGAAAPQAYATTGWTDRVFYELHVGTFRDPDPNDALPGTFYDAIGGLDHLADLGITDVELMPVAEFPTARSWGYNPTYPLAVEASYGGREGLRAFTAACHARGLRVHADIVFNHLVGTNSDLWAFNGASATNLGGIYFYGDTARCSTVWGPRPDYDRPEVRALILDTVQSYLDLGCDGLRWDAVSQMFYSASAFIPAATNLLRDAGAAVRARGGSMIAENAAVRCRIGFDAEWSYAVHAVLVDQLARTNEMIMNTGAISDALRATALTNVIFLENHDTAGLLNSAAQRWPVRVSTNGQSQAEARARARLGAVIEFTCRGTPMLFQGQEFGHTNLWHDDRPLSWTDPDAAQHEALYRDLIRLRRNLDGVTAGLLTTQQTVSMYGRPSGLDIHRGGASNRVVVAINLSQTGAVHWSMSFPVAGWWHVALSSDDTAYGGSGAGLHSVYVVNTNDLDLLVPGLTAVVLTQGLPPARDADGDGLSNGQEVEIGTDPLDPASAAACGGLRRAGAGFELDVTCAPGGTRWLEASPDLAEWSAVLQTNAAGLRVTIPLPESAETQRFFRVR